MGFWSFLKKTVEPAAKQANREAPRGASAPKIPSLLPEDLARLLRVGESEGPSTDDALALLRHLRATSEEGRALDELISRNHKLRLPEPLAVAVAGALVDRGEPGAALRLIAHSSSSAALLMRADLHAEAGEVPTALALAERVLLRDFDHPGARDRHRRWRTLLGFTSVPRPSDAEGATVVTREPEAPFRLLREVARGGAGAVYEAEDRELLRKVALKVYHHVERDRPQLVHEARVASALRGPGIVRVFDIDPTHGWIALEWAPRGALRDRIRARDREVLVPVERWALPLAAALARAHAAGWVHHDVKPANVLLTADGRPLLADFGIARRIGETSPRGSLGYISPQRMHGRASDPRDDVFGFGRVLEDTLDALADADLEARWRPLAAACVGGDDARPADARAVVTRLKVEGAA